MVAIDERQRAMAMGMQNVAVRALGSVPGANLPCDHPRPCSSLIIVDNRAYSLRFDH